MVGTNLLPGKFKYYGQDLQRRSLHQKEELHESAQLETSFGLVVLIVRIYDTHFESVF